VAMFFHEMVAGYFIGLTVPASHVTTETDWPVVNKDPKTGELSVDVEWAVNQVATTKDYGHGNWFFKHFIGGLNDHSCHHLLPTIHHSYYEELYPIIKQAAKEFNIQIREVETQRQLIFEFFQHLWNMGYDNKRHD